MASFRVETVVEPGTGLIYAAAFSNDSEVPIAQSGAIFHTHEEAEAEVIGLIRNAWPDRTPVAVDPSIGV